MDYLRRILWPFWRRTARPGGYDAEVLFAGWVELPKAFREIISRR